MNRTTMQFVRVTSRAEYMEIWNTNRNGFSFVICYESRNGPGLHGAPGFVGSWRPLLGNSFAVKIIGSPFKTFEAAEQACETMLGYLTEEREAAE
jgi:hypothetical protein